MFDASRVIPRGRYSCTVICARYDDSAGGWPIVLAVETGRRKSVCVFFTGMSDADLHDDGEGLQLLRDLLPEGWSDFVVRDNPLCHGLDLSARMALYRIHHERGWRIDIGGLYDYLHDRLVGRVGEVVIGREGCPLDLRIIHSRKLAEAGKAPPTATMQRCDTFAKARPRGKRTVAAGRRCLTKCMNGMD